MGHAINFSKVRISRIQKAWHYIVNMGPPYVSHKRGWEVVQNGAKGGGKACKVVNYVD